MNQKKAKAVRMQLRSEGIAVSEGQWGPMHRHTSFVLLHNKVPLEKRVSGRPSGVREHRFQFDAHLPGRMFQGCGRKVYQTLKLAVKRGVASLPPLAWYHEQRALQAMDRV